MEDDLSIFLDSIYLLFLSEEDRLLLDAPVTLEDLWQVLVDTNTNKAPGADWVVLLKLLKGSLLQSMNEALIIVPLKPEKDLLLLDCY